MKKTYALSCTLLPVALSALLALSSCGKLDSDDKTIPRRDINLTKSEMEYVQEGNSLAFRFYCEVYYHGNFIISPFSLQRCLGMIQNGAAGQTHEEISSVIGYDKADNTTVNKFLKSYTDQLLAVDPSTTLELADALLVGNWFPVEEDFSTTVSSSYEAEVKEMDFFNEPEKTKKWINDWAREKTGGMIPSLVDNVDPLTVSMALNALVFKGKWASVFDPGKTNVAQPFYLWGDKIGTADMMNQAGHFEYAEDEQFKLLCLPYGNGAFQMVILLPRTPDGDLSSVDLELWRGLLSRTKEVDLPVSIPRFRISTTMSLDGPLSEMGMPTAFTSDADFSKISGAPGEVRMRGTRQSCLIAVDEGGTQGAAATVVPVGFVTAPPPPPLTFVADHPFLFAIVEKSTQGILLMGQYCGRE